MFNEAIKFHKYMIPVFLVVCLIFFLTGCAAFERRPAIVEKSRSARVIECVDRFLMKDLKASISYEICKDIYKRSE